jgi:ABC-type nitrate/sulfonate/bicarbonate transport system ATPase subunit
LIAEAPAHHQRGHVARVGERPCLPEHATATEVLDLSWALRAAALGSTTSAPSAQARLERFGLGHLAARQVRALAHVDQRALALCEALTGAAPVLVLSEPLAHVAAAALPAIADGLRERVAASAVVLVTALADHGLPEAVQRFALSRGVLSPLSTAPVAESPGALRVVGADLRALTQALAGNPDVRQMHWADDEAQPGGHAVLTLHGTSRLALARAVQTAATSQGIALDRWEFR